MSERLRRIGCRVYGHKIRTRSVVVAVEYGLIASLVALAIIVAVTALGANLGMTLSRVAENLK